MSKIYNNPSELIQKAGESLLSFRAIEQNPGKWQGLEISQSMIEVFDSTFRTLIPDNVEDLQIDCSPDLPWAEDHFKERIGGQPTNPGETYKYWPYYKEDKKIRDEIFTHTYQERFWPKLDENLEPIRGIRYKYGDYLDVVKHLSGNPNSRQAYLPIWFPEDTGVNHKGRVPCTLGYLFNYRNGYLHLTYYIRSCDYIRHFKNDVYLACRLLIHTIEMLKRTVSPIDWAKVKPGRLKMDVESLHIFDSDIYELKKRLK